MHSHNVGHVQQTARVPCAHEHTRDPLPLGVVPPPAQRRCARFLASAGAPALVVPHWGFPRSCDGVMQPALPATDSAAKIFTQLLLMW